MVERGCATTFRDKMMYFGGSSDPSQVSEVENCKIRRKGTLPFDFIGGSCNTFNEPESNRPQMYLCFGSNEELAIPTEVPMEYSCWFFKSASKIIMAGYDKDSDSSNTWTLVESKHSHRNTLSLGNYRGRPFVTGCDDPSKGCFTKTEIMDSGFRRFYDGPDYPFDFASRSVKTLFTRELGISI